MNNEQIQNLFQVEVEVVNRYTETTNAGEIEHIQVEVPTSENILYITVSIAV